MIHLEMKEPQINKANYTTLLKDISVESKELIKALFRQFLGTSNDDLYDIFFAKFRYYEINDIDENVFIQCVTDTYTQYSKYYKEIYDNYTKAYDIKLDNKRVTSRSDTSSSQKQEIVNTTSANTNKHYDLPHKTVQDELVDGYVDDVTKDNGSNNTTGSGNSSNTYGSIVTTQYDNEFLSLKRQYMAQIRNVYDEFCYQFNDCFLKIYS